MKWRILSQQQQDLVLFILGRLRELLVQLHLTIHQQLVMRLRRYKMNHEKFIEKCKAIVRERIENEIADLSGAVPEFSVFIVWSCKTLQNSKALVSASLKGAPYFEITLNGDKGEIYVDTYLKKSNECIKV